MMDPNDVLFEDLPPLSKTGRFLLPPRRSQQRCNTFIMHACNTTRMLRDNMPIGPQVVYMLL